jgi:hypothetical protein
MLEVVVLIEVTLDLVNELDAASSPPADAGSNPPDDVAGVSDAALLPQVGDAPVGSIGNIFTLLAGDLFNLELRIGPALEGRGRVRTGADTRPSSDLTC